MTASRDAIKRRIEALEAAAGAREKIILFAMAPMTTAQLKELPPSATVFCWLPRT